MDGLTISNSDGPLERQSALREVRSGRPEVLAPAAGADDGPSLADQLKSAVQSVNQAQKEADFKMQELATGRTHNIHDVMLSAEKADISLRLMTQVRNKIIEAYQEVMKMQV